MFPYFTVIIPYVSAPYATVWHPTEDKGPFAILTCGAFPTEEAAIEWARAKLAGAPYSIQRVDVEY